jgi:hypothetical protein
VSPPLLLLGRAPPSLLLLLACEDLLLLLLGGRPPPLLLPFPLLLLVPLGSGGSRMFVSRIFMIAILLTSLSRSAASASLSLRCLARLKEALSSPPMPSCAWM